MPWNNDFGGTSSHEGRNPSAVGSHFPDKCSPRSSSSSCRSRRSARESPSKNGDVFFINTEALSSRQRSWTSRRLHKSSPVTRLGPLNHKGRGRFWTLRAQGGGREKELCLHRLKEQPQGNSSSLTRRTPEMQCGTPKPEFSVLLLTWCYEHNKSCEPGMWRNDPFGVVFKDTPETGPSSHPLPASVSPPTVGRSKETHMCMSTPTPGKSRGSWGHCGSELVFQASVTPRVLSPPCILPPGAMERPSTEYPVHV